MKTRMQKFAESRFFIPATVILYLLLAGILFAVIGARTKPDIEVLLTRWFSRFLWADFLLIVIGVALCRRDIAAAFRELFTVPPRPVPLPPEEKESGMNLPSGEISRLRNFHRPGIYLLLILIAGFLLVTLAAPQVHRIYYDEDIYANMGQNIAYTGQTGMTNYGTFEYGEYFVNWLVYNKDPSGWPFLISLVFQLFGTDETYAFYLNNLLFAGGILVVFFITRIVAGGWFAGLVAALIYALIPHNLVWSNTIAAENPAAFFGGLVVLCTLVWLRSREARHLFLLAAVLPFASAMRPESAMIGLWALAAAAVNLFSDTSMYPGALPHHSPPLPNEKRDAGLNLPHPFTTRIFWAMGLVSFAFAIPLVWHFYAMSGQSWGADGAKFATGYFPKNLAVNGFYYLNNSGFPVLFTLLAATGLAGWHKEKRGFLPVAAILLWFLLFWGIFLFFYAGSYQYGADVRFALVSFMPLAVLGGIGAEVMRMSRVGRQISGETGAGADDGSARSGTAPGRLSVAALLILVLIVSWIKFLPLVRLVGQEAWGARYDHTYAREFIKKIPNRAIVLTHIPTMFLLWGQNAIQTYAGVNNPDIIRDLMNRYGGHVYFHQSYWCNTLNDSNRQVCDGIRQRYNLEPVATAREQVNEYGLYRMTFK
ncbi:MAG: ArnT family glycosyltransferase [Syntrophales bacterium]